MTTHENIILLTDFLEKREGVVTRFDRDSYNGQVNNMIEAMSNFVSLHYSLSSREDNQYWKDVTENIDYVNVHGTSTPLGDVAEVKAIEEVFGEHAYNLNISSTKSMTGHLLGAAGAIEAIACVLSVKENVVPPTINNTIPDPALDEKLNFTFNKAEKRTVNIALSNTFGVGGHNTSIIVKKHTP
mgnify:CR=1 FL=1